MRQALSLHGVGEQSVGPLQQCVGCSGLAVDGPLDVLLGNVQLLLAEELRMLEKQRTKKITTGRRLGMNFTTTNSSIMLHLVPPCTPYYIIIILW